MNAVPPTVIPTQQAIEKRFAARRRKGGNPLDRLLRRLLGLDAKTRQYVDGVGVRPHRRRPGRARRLQRDLDLAADAADQGRDRRAAELDHPRPRLSGAADPHPAGRAVRQRRPRTALRATPGDRGAGRLLRRRRLARARRGRRLRGAPRRRPRRAGHRRPRPAGPGSAEQAARVAALGYELGLDPVEVVRVAVGHGRGPGGRGPHRPLRRARCGRRRPRAGSCCSGTPSTTRPRRCCSGSAAAPGRARSPACRRAPAATAPVARRAPRDHRGRLPTRSASTPGTTRTTPTRALQRVRLRTRGAAAARGRAAGRRRRGAGPHRRPAAGRRRRARRLGRRDRLALRARPHDGDHRDGELPVAALAPCPARCAPACCGTGRWPAARAVSAEHVAALDALVTDWHGQGPIDLPGGVGVRRASGQTRPRRAPPPGRQQLSPLDADIEEVLVSAEQIQAKIAELATQIDADYADREPLLVGVLKGAVMFMSDLARALERPSTMEFMAVSSYGSAHHQLRRGADPQGPRPRHRRRSTCSSSRTSSTRG